MQHSSLEALGDLTVQKTLAKKTKCHRFRKYDQTTPSNGPQLFSLKHQVDVRRLGKVHSVYFETAHFSKSLKLVNKMSFKWNIALLAGAVTAGVYFLQKILLKRPAEKIKPDVVKPVDISLTESEFSFLDPIKFDNLRPSLPNTDTGDLSSVDQEFPYLAPTLFQFIGLSQVLTSGINSHHHVPEQQSEAAIG